MIITSSITWDIETWRVLDHQWSYYVGPVHYCKGEDTANAQRQQELDMQKQAFDFQKQILQSLQGPFSQYLSGNVGFSPQMLATMNTQFLNQNAADFQSAGQQVRSALGARGAGTGQMPVGGDYVRGIASLMGAQAQSQAGGLNQIRLQNALQALNNKFNAGNLLSGNAATLTGTQGVAGYGASSALESYIKGMNSGPLNSLLGGLGSGFGEAFGGAMGKGLSGGIGKMLSGGSSSGGS